MNRNVFGVTGWKNSGKTTLVEALVSELTRRGFTVATVKHAHHDFDIDKEGTDSFRHRRAGAREVAIVSDRRWALMHELRDEAEPRLENILARLSPSDIVLVEGYKRDSHKKIEARRAEARSQEPLAPGDPNIVAIASDHPIAGGTLPVFDINDIAGMADLIERMVGLKQGG
ncbi:MAG TPA: molybdopterin-guanine dinucleotide biosynthesis protein B [Rhizobiaceae bacterium]|nr:molybdopterin-guanine dinucleotide biosynthesis protein B [Rhizobiaceae bacterium]